MAQAFYYTKEYKRAVHFLRENDLINKSLRFSLLGTQATWICITSAYV
jgi:hypothetical protein